MMPTQTTILTLATGMQTVLTLASGLTVLALQVRPATVYAVALPEANSEGSGGPLFDDPSNAGWATNV